MVDGAVVKTRRAAGLDCSPLVASAALLSLGDHTGSTYDC